MPTICRKQDGADTFLVLPPLDGYHLTEQADILKSTKVLRTHQELTCNSFRIGFSSRLFKKSLSDVEIGLHNELFRKIKE